MSALKSMVAAVSSHGHIAWTGSTMVTFMNHARVVPTNGYMLIAHMRFVQLGGTPSTSAATAMATELGQAYAASHGWPEHVRQAIATGTFVQKQDSIATGGMLSPRPALVVHMLGLMRPASSGSVEAMVDAAVGDALEKLRDESRSDFTTALVQLEMTPLIKRGLFELARVNRRRLDHLRIGNTAMKMLSLLCDEASEKSGSQSTLLPPYATFVKECLNEDGDVIVRWTGMRNELGDKLRGILNFFSETYADRLFTIVHLRKISAAVAKSLHDNGIGVDNPTTGILSAVCGARDVGKVPVLAALLQHPANSKLADDHARKLSDSEGLPQYSLAICFHVLLWARNVSAHDPHAADGLARMGLSAATLDAAALAAAVAVCGVPKNNGLVFQIGRKGVPERGRGQAGRVYSA